MSSNDLSSSECETEARGWLSRTYELQAAAGILSRRDSCRFCRTLGRTARSEAALPRRVRLALHDRVALALRARQPDGVRLGHRGHRELRCGHSALDSPRIGRAVAVVVSRERHGPPGARPTD